MRGGKRPGAGAPKGNMNAMKHGGYSKQFAQIGALFASDPRTREALLALAERHNLRQQRANEVAALLFTRLFQRAEDIAARRAVHPVGALLAAPSGGRGTTDGLNLDLPVHDSDTIKLAAGRAAARQIRTALRSADKESKKAHHNQTPHTNARQQSPRSSSRAAGV